MSQSRLKRGDLVIIVAGKDKGKQGGVLQVFAKQNRVLVSGINVAMKHLKPNKNSPNGGIVGKELPIHCSNVSHIDPKAGVPTKIGYKLLDGVKLRYAKRSGELIDKI